jgi:hypothetical protein
MTDTLVRAIAVAFRAFADEIERGGAQDGFNTGQTTPTVGGPESMIVVLREVARINDEQKRGATQAELRTIAGQAGMNPRGTAGYYAAGLLETRSDARWITKAGRDRLGDLVKG